MMRYHIKKRIKFLLLTVAVVCLTAVPSFAVEYYLCAQNISMTMPDGTPVPMWGFALDHNADLADKCLYNSATVPGPKLVVPAGDNQLIIHLRNDLTGPGAEPVSFIIPGQAMPVASPPVFVGDRVRSFVQEAATGGGIQTYTWNNIQPGTYTYQTGTHPQVGVQMGLYGTLVKDAAAGVNGGGVAYTGINYTAARDLFFSEVDPALHAAVANGKYGTPEGPTSTLNYKPKYFLLHGYHNRTPYDVTIGLLPDGTVDPENACINSGMAVGDDILLRIYNAGLRELAPMMLGSHFNLVAEGGRPYPFPYTQYEALLMPGSTRDAIFAPEYAGNFNIIERRGNLTDGPQTGGGMQTCLEALTAGANRTPTADANGPYVGLFGNDITFDGSGSFDPDGDGLTYSWDFGDGTPAGSGVAPAHNYAARGIYTVTLTVNDGTADSVPSVTTATVFTPGQPVPYADGPYDGSVNNPIIFSARGSFDPNGDPLTFSWNFGDGSPLATGVAPSHIYLAAGIYTVTLTVSDGTVDVLAATSANIAVGDNLSIRRLFYDGGQDLLLAEVRTNSSAEIMTMSAMMDRDGDGTYETDLGGVNRETRGMFKLYSTNFNTDFGFAPNADSVIKFTSSEGGIIYAKMQIR